MHLFLCRAASVYDNDCTGAFWGCADCGAVHNTSMLLKVMFVLMVMFVLKLCF
jgi:hypothetical protein